MDYLFGGNKKLYNSASSVSLRLIFDSNSKTVVVKPCADDSPYACKIVPAKISYSAVEKMLSGKLDDFVEEKIQYVL